MSKLSKWVSAAEGASEASSPEQANEWEVWANERTDKQVAQYFHLDSWLFWPTVVWYSGVLFWRFCLWGVLQMVSFLVLIKFCLQVGFLRISTKTWRTNGRTEERAQRCENALKKPTKTNRKWAGEIFLNRSVIKIKNFEVPNKKKSNEINDENFAIKSQFLWSCLTDRKKTLMLSVSVIFSHCDKMIQLLPRECPFFAI